MILRLHFFLLALLFLSSCLDFDRDREGGQGAVLLNFTDPEILEFEQVTEKIDHEGASSHNIACAGQTNVEFSFRFRGMPYKLEMTCTPFNMDLRLRQELLMVFATRRLNQSVKGSPPCVVEPCEIEFEGEVFNQEVIFNYQPECRERFIFNRNGLLTVSAVDPACTIFRTYPREYTYRFRQGSLELSPGRSGDFFTSELDFQRFTPI